MSKIIYSNSINLEVTWLNSSDQTIKIMVINEKGNPVRASRLMPKQEIPVPPNGYIELI